MLPKYVSIALFLWLIAASATGQSLAPFEAEYRVKMGALRGAMRMSLTHGEDGLVASSLLEPRGLAGLFARGRVEETAWLAIDADRVVPQRYAMIDTIDKDNEEIAMNFDWVTQVASGSSADGDFDHAIDLATYDRTSIQYALMLDLLHGRSAAQYTMLDGKRRKALTISHLGDSVVKVPLGEFKVRKVRHQAANSSRMVTLYCAPELGFLPVRIEQHRKGKLVVRADLKAHRTPG